MPCPIQTSWFDRPNKIRSGAQIVQLLHMQSSTNANPAFKNKARMIFLFKTYQASRIYE